MPEVFTQVRLLFELGNGKVIKPAFNMAFDNAGTWEAVPFAELDDVANDVAAVLPAPGIMGDFASDVTCTGVEVQNFVTVAASGQYPNGRISPTTITVPSGATSIAGTVAGESATPQSSLIVTLYSTLPGKRNRGRMYLPPPPEGNVDSTGAVSSAYAAAVFADLGGIITAAVSAPTDIPDVVVVSRKGQTLEPIAPGAAGIVVRTLVRTQRRRALSY